ncbi:DUF305 domain-containing protein [Mycolicibacterium duvalii]|uniref:DUF305 domain-containing protein n=1 Tax=Mycolicibacterium duvalii TaxID=39688 RepID=A0A7I7JU64_9MYCO|nr:DUF305 domain-containing protein [Mycolicibacterium duvalii]
MNSTRRVPAAAGAAVAALVLLMSGCSSDDSTESAQGTTHEEHAAHDHGSAPDGAAHNEATHNEATHNEATHNEADAAFARDMVPHHEQAIVMSDIVLGKQGIDQRVLDLADRIKAAQGPEIDTMRQWLTVWQVPEAEHHGHHGASHEEMGMMSEADLDRLRNAEGVDAARLFLTGMIAHHEGAVRMAQTEVDTGKSAEAVHLARDIIATQQREIDEMRQILDSL